MKSHSQNPLRTYLGRNFVKFTRKEKIGEAQLCKTIEDIENGIIDADLGGGVIKQRISRQGQGKSGGYRVLILFKFEDKAVFVHGFAKNDMANISPEKERELKQLARFILPLSVEKIDLLLAKGDFTEILRKGNKND